MTQPKEYLRERTLEGDIEQLNLKEEIAGLKEKTGENEVGGKTLVKLPGLSVVLVQLKKGAQLEEHSVSGPATVQVCSGKVQLTINNAPETFEEGTVGVIGPDVPHDARALEDSILLLTFNEKG